jgi:hypothetical protein
MGVILPQYWGGGQECYPPNRKGGQKKAALKWRRFAENQSSGALAHFYSGASNLFKSPL